MHDHIHSHRDFDDNPEPLDTAGQSLSDALRVSFNVLKIILVALVILYCFSGFGWLEQNEQALVLRFGKLQEEVLGPGGFYAQLPRPADELIKIPVAQNRTFTIRSQQMLLRLRDDGELQTYEEASAPGSSLDPSEHGTVMTGDHGLVHVEWVVTYRISDLRKFVKNIYLTQGQSEEEVIKVAVESASISAIGQRSAVDVVLNRILEIETEVKLRTQKILDSIGPEDAQGSGIQIATISPKPYWPKNIKRVFDSVTKASNQRDKTIEDAEQFRTETLNATAGATHEELGGLFNRYMTARSNASTEQADQVMREIEQLILSDRTTGQAKERLQLAESFRKNALEDIQRDYNQYLSFLDEYHSNPRMLFSRLWNETQRELRSSPGVSTRHLPAGQLEVRVQIGPDPEEKRRRETSKYGTKEKEAGDFSKVRRGDRRPVISREGKAL